MGSVVEDNPYGLKLLVTLIEEKAALIPSHTWLRFPGEDWENNGYTTVTWRQYLNGINKVAHWLDETLGKSTDNDAVAYSGPNDIRYALVWLAVIKTGRKLLVCDGRITGQGLKNLLTATQAKAWLFADDRWTLEVASVHDFKTEQKAFPSLKWCLDADEAPHYAYNKTWEEAKDEEILIIHTSGTTGFPKAIWCTNGFLSSQQMAKIVSKKYWPQLFFSDVQARRVGISAYPPKWGAGLGYMVAYPVFSDHLTVVLPEDTIGLPPDLLKKVLRWNPDVEGLHGPPQTIAGLWKDSTTQPLLKELQFIIYAGAAMDQTIGDEISLHTRIMPLIGSTEGGLRFYPIAKDRKLWNTFAYIAEGPHRMVKRKGYGDAEDGSDDLYELVVDRPADGSRGWFLGTFWNLRWYKDANTVETRELYSPVTDLDGTTRWVFRARTDDLTKLSFLAKFNAAHIEARILRHPWVKHVLVGGEGRPAPYVIIEPKDEVLGHKPAEELLDTIYNEIVAQANQEDIGEIRIPRQTVFLATAGKPFKINLKALVLRRETEEEYKEEIENIYAKFEAKESRAKDGK